SSTAPHTADAGVAAAATPGAVEKAEIIDARGAVQARIGEKGPWSEAAIGDKLNTDDAVRAGRNAEATLRMGNGVEVRLSPRSEFTIRELSESVSKIRLEEGHVTASVDENGKRTLRVAARGTDAEAESKGGAFGVVTDGKGQLAVATSTGSVKLSAGGQTVDVAAGQISQLAGGVPSAPRAIPASLFLKVAELGAKKTKETSVTVNGATDPGSLVHAGDATAKVDERGRFRIQIPLKDGDNSVTVDVTDASGRTRTQALPTIVVDRKKPPIEAETKWGTPAPTTPN
ncbi:MAG TPA: FecR domain-containing protein, partial [Myxococcota bacterium]